MNVYKSTFYFTVYILFTLKIFAVGLSVFAYLMSVSRAYNMKVLNFHIITNKNLIWDHDFDLYTSLDYVTFHLLS